MGRHNMQGGATGLAYRGRTASIGFAHGPLVRVDVGTNGARVAGNLAEEALALRAAIDRASGQIADLAGSAGGGLALLGGSPTSHVAMLARARGIPMVVQLGVIPEIGATALLDGEGATLELDPSAEQVRLFETRRESHRKSRASARAILRRPTASWRGERIKLFINIQRVDDLEHAEAQYADGIGLMRTEF